MALGELEQHYLAHHRALGHSEKTINHYECSFLLLHKFLEETNKPLESSSLTTAVMQEFIAWLRQTPTRGFRGNTTRTPDGIHGVMRDMRAFTRYLVAEGRLDKQPKVPIPTLPKHLFPVLSEAQLGAILTCRQLDCRTEIGKRNRALIAFLLDTGVRLSEVSGLQLDDLFLKENAAKVQGKGNKQRMVYFSDGVAASLRMWLVVRGDEPGPVFWLKNSGIRQVMRRIQAETNLPMLFAHQLRHTALTLLVKGDMDLHSVKRMAGHASVTTTEAYLALAQEDIREKQHQASPFDRIIGQIEPERQGKRRLKSA
jgi:site-specific recombinase XerD